MKPTLWNNVFDYLEQYSYDLYLLNLIETLPNGAVLIWS